MAHTTIIVNGETLLDDNLGQWTSTPPPAIEALSHPKERRHWMYPVMATLVPALISDHPISITVTTNGTNWSMSVDNGNHK